MQSKNDKGIKKASQKKELKSRGMVTVPYVKGLSKGSVSYTHLTLPTKRIV